MLTRLADDGLMLETSDADGRNLAPLLRPGDGLAPYQWPRYSPDWAVVAFAAAQSTVRALLASPHPVMDGRPQDLWIIDIATGEPSLVVELQEDFPAIAWHRDGLRPYVYGARGLYEVSLENGAVHRIGKGMLHGHMAYAP